MQRLFSTFPNSWPGVGLLLIRLCLATALICSAAIDAYGNAADETAVLQHLLAFAGGLFLIAGLWTPVIAVLVALEEASRALPFSGPPRAAAWMHVFLAVLSAGVAMLGPGAWSVDARLFGRERFDIDRSRVRKPSHLHE